MSSRLTIIALATIGALAAGALAGRRRRGAHPSTSRPAASDQAPAPYTPNPDPDLWRRQLPPQINGVAVAPSTDPGRPARAVSTSEARFAYKLLDFLKTHGAPYGARVRVAFPAHLMVAHFAEHPPDKGKAYPHPGVALLEAT